MYCANHPDIPAMANCQVCNKPLCALCVNYRDGQTLCGEHFAAAEKGGTPGGLAQPSKTRNTAPLSFPERDAAPTTGLDKSEVVTESLDNSVVAETRDSGAQPAVSSGLADTQLGGRNSGPNPYVYQGGPAPVDFSQPIVNRQLEPRYWEADPRLQPLPLSMRPGWTQDPLEAPQNGAADTMSIAGLIIGLVALPFSICCGFGAPFGFVLALIGGGLSIAAIVQAGKSRNPQQTRIMAGVGVGAATLALLISIVFMALFFGAFFIS